MTAQAFSFTKIHVEDLAAAESFYTQVLGLEVVGYLTLGEGEELMREVILKTAGAEGPVPNLILVTYPNRACPAAGEATTGFVVDDLDATLEKTTQAGGTIQVPATDLPEHNLRAAYIFDPQGHRVELLQHLQA
jgi:predicted enzyme related to lactoylglutathione lyase